MQVEIQFNPGDEAAAHNTEARRGAERQKIFGHSPPAAVKKESEAAVGAHRSLTIVEARSPHRFPNFENRALAAFKTIRGG